MGQWLAVIFNYRSTSNNQNRIAIHNDAAIECDPVCQAQRPQRVTMVWLGSCPSDDRDLDMERASSCERSTSSGEKQQIEFLSMTFRFEGPFVSIFIEQTFSCRQNKQNNVTLSLLRPRQSIIVPETVPIKGFNSPEILCFPFLLFDFLFVPLLFGMITDWRAEFDLELSRDCTDEQDELDWGDGEDKSIG